MSENAIITVSGLFGDDEIAKQTEDEQLALYGTLCVILSNAVEAAHKKNYDLAERLLNLAESNAGRMKCDKFFFLVGAVRIDISWRRNLELSEFFFQEMFKKNVSRLIAGTTIVSGKIDKHNKPDAWVDLNGELIPVEVKNEAFDKNAMKQINRYISFFGCKRGIAIGTKLSVELPHNVLFFSTDQVLKADEEGENE